MITDTLGHVTLTLFDGLNRPISTTVNFKGSGAFNSAMPDQNVTTLTRYDATGNVISNTHYAFTSLARTTVTGYDSANRPVTVTANYAGTGSFDPSHPDQNLTNVTVYGPAGERQATAELRGGPGLGAAVWITTTYGYDNLGRLITTTAPLTGSAVAITSRAYDGLDRLTDTTDPLGHIAHTDYDGVGRPITTTANYVNGGGSDSQTNLRTVTTYDAAGDRIKLKDPNLNVTQFQYDLLARLVTVTDTLAGVTRYGYDAAGDLLTVLDANSHPLTHTYDLLNRLLSTTDPLTHTTVYTYSAASDRVAMLDALGQVTNYAYDLLDRQTAITYPAGTPSVAFAYDLISRRTVMTDGIGTTSWTFDAADRPLTITQPYVGAAGYAYDSAGDRLSLKYPDGKVVTGTYDLARRLVQVTDWQAGVVTYTYNALGQPTGAGLPNGVIAALAYDSVDRLATLTNTRGSLLTLLAYGYDADGNRTKATEKIRQPSSSLPTTTITYTYDADYRLLSANYSTGAVFTYTYR